MNVAELVKNGISQQTQEGSDTFQVWENYREQATLWRIIALAQLVTTPLIILFCIFIYTTRSVTVHVPDQPAPGYYRTNEIPKSRYIEKGVDFLNLVASYQPAVARKQYMLAAEMLDAEGLQKFQEESIDLELKAIENTQRTQMYFIDPTKTEIKYKRGFVYVTYYGERQKFISGRELPSVITKYLLTMKTVPRQGINPYGIVIADFSSENILK